MVLEVQGVQVEGMGRRKRMGRMRTMRMRRKKKK
jgi:hypothetical protein